MAQPCPRSVPYLAAPEPEPARTPAASGSEGPWTIFGKRRTFCRKPSGPRLSLAASWHLVCGRGGSLGGLPAQDGVRYRIMILGASDGKRTASGTCRRRGRQSSRGRLARKVAHLRTRRPETEVVAGADGALDNRTLPKQLVPDAEVLDFRHACEPVREVAEPAQASGGYENDHGILRYDSKGAGKLTRRALLAGSGCRPGSDGKRSGTCLVPEASPSHALPRPEGPGIPIGSGGVESLDRARVTRRTKPSGMRWRIAGDQAVPQFRARVQSDRVAPAWRTLTATLDPPAVFDLDPHAPLPLVAGPRRKGLEPQL